MLVQAIQLQQNRLNSPIMSVVALERSFPNFITNNSQKIDRIDLSRTGQYLQITSIIQLEYLEFIWRVDQWFEIVGWIVQKNRSCVHWFGGSWLIFAIFEQKFEKYWEKYRQK